MSRGGAGWQGVAGAVTGSQPAEKTDAPQREEASPVSTVSTASTGRGAPVVRNLVRAVLPLLTVREVAAELAVSGLRSTHSWSAGNWSGCGLGSPSASRLHRSRPSCPGPALTLGQWVPVPAPTAGTGTTWHR
jgi:hypothetical protein